MSYLMLFLTLLVPRKPESVLATEMGVFVSDIGEFGSFPDGKIFRFKGDSVTVYADSLVDPKGLAYFRGKLYVADRDRLWELTDSTKSIYVDADSFPTSPEFLNDLAIDSSGNLYVSDTWGGVIFRVDTTGKASIFARVESPNGIAWHDEKLYCVSFTKPGKLYVIENGKALEIFSSDKINGADGLAIKGEKVYISGYASGNILTLKLKDNQAEGAEILQSNLTTPADICISPRGDTLYVPLLQKGKIITLEIEK